ncbi:MAG: PIN domain-containing protein, partial [Limisphaerales bacterium]
MIPAVFDCGVVLAGTGWTGNPRHCLDLVFSGQVRLCVTTDVWAEYDARIPLVLAERKRDADAAAVLSRLLRIAHFVDAAPLGKQRSRDVKDDRYLACALGALAVAVVSNDRD